MQTALLRQVAVPPFLEKAQQALSRSGRQMRLLASMPDRLAGRLLMQLLASTRAECMAAAAVAADDPWAGRAAHPSTARRPAPLTVWCGSA